MLLSEVGFGSFLSYTPRPFTEAGRQSKNVMWSLKANQLLGNPPISVAERIAQRLAEQREALPFRHFFDGTAIAIPVPKSSLAKPGSLWVPLMLCNALKAAGLIAEVLPCLTRKHALPKSATSAANTRSTVLDHYQSLEAERTLVAPDQFVLVDDIITRGATLLGCAQRLKEAYPEIPIYAFAAMRSISEEVDFTGLTDPCVGMVTLRGGQTYRRP